MKTYSLKITAIVIFLAATAHSCEKEEICKSGDCITVDIKGSVRVLPSGEGLPNVPVEVDLIKNGTLWNFGRKVGSRKTDRNGEFDFKGTIDRTFEASYISVEIPNQKNYINISNEKRFWYPNYANLNLTNLNFVFYNKASLTINLNRTQTDVFDVFFVLSTIENDFENRKNRFYTLYSDAKNATRQFETSADVYTKIWVYKQINEESILESVDSLICRQNENNIININY